MIHFNELRKIEMSKKGKEISQVLPTEDSEMFPLFSDTTCNKECGSSSWEIMYKLFEDENPKVITKISTTGTKSTSDATYFDVACSFIHKVTARPKIKHYKDMVKWVIDHLSVDDRKFKDSKGEYIGSFRVEYLKAMCHLPSLQQKYDKAFLQIFREEHPDLMKVIKE